MDRYLSRMSTRIKRRLNTHDKTATEAGNAPNLADEHHAPTNQVQADLTIQLTSELSNRAIAEPSNQLTPESTDEVPDQLGSGSGGQDASPTLVLASADTKAQSSNPAPESSDAISRRTLWQQAYNKLCTEEDFDSKLLHYEKYVLAHANVAASAKTNQSLIQEWVRKELDNLSEKRVVIVRQGKQVVVRDKIYEVIKFIVKYKDLVKAGVSADPTAALAWGGAMAIIPFLQNVFQQDEDAATGFEDICFLTLQSNVVEHRLNELRQKRMEQEIVNIYATSLRYQIRLLVHYQHGSLVRTGRDAVQADAWNDMLKDAKNANAKISGGFTTLGSDMALSELPAISEGVKALREQMTLTCVGAALFDSREVEEHGGYLEGTPSFPRKPLRLPSVIFSR
ncbi:uncharacterized protein NECHADRAFT_82205 [Fusarium vanettenii 77-13-4]|uniref:NWD NACHT-NTPase N-terminal domain-containing protein n=1 Tax=Fusarium vanettenii (strain ATCC MYA-4622 / CBS 123669 / FGSC 9596 / NRRL 45880 / 77-13-4) TaxID=660122 RepID=C7ZJR3_FUSV7|nr:uncharacterized protein NECHADRAFT_82205 [Fusarium vanettenii 77-13-4]EEU35785.1 hypothetical protein NECHADRAFT_82205 [Fusarium vanettenii 77-13-4]